MFDLLHILLLRLLLLPLGSCNNSSGSGKKGRQQVLLHKKKEMD
jgi:hypothetical protein